MMIPTRGAWSGIRAALTRACRPAIGRAPSKHNVNLRVLDLAPWQGGRTISKPRARPSKEAREALSRLTDENALLRAALAEARARLGEAEESAGRDPLTAPRWTRASSRASSSGC